MNKKIVHMVCVRDRSSCQNDHDFPPLCVFVMTEYGCIVVLVDEIDFLLNKHQVISSTKTKKMTPAPPPNTNDLDLHFVLIVQQNDDDVRVIRTFL